MGACSGKTKNIVPSVIVLNREQLTQSLEKSIPFSSSNSNISKKIIIEPNKDSFEGSFTFKDYFPFASKKVE